jgi:hypothetical protein
VDGVETTDIDREIWEAAVHESAPAVSATNAVMVDITSVPNDGPRQLQWQELRHELFEIRELLALRAGLVPL